MAHTKAQMDESNARAECSARERARETEKTHANSRETDAEMNIKYLVNNAHVRALTHTRTHTRTHWRAHTRAVHNAKCLVDANRNC